MDGTMHFAKPYSNRLEYLTREGGALLVATAQQRSLVVREALQQLEAQRLFCKLWNSRLRSGKARIAGVNPNLTAYEAAQAVMAGHDQDMKEQEEQAASAAAAAAIPDSQFG